MPKQKANAGVKAVCPSASAFVIFEISLSPISYMDDNDIYFAALRPSSIIYSWVFSPILPITLQWEKLSMGY